MTTSEHDIATAHNIHPDARAPWRPRVAGIAGLVLGPMAAAIVSFINLRRLSASRKGGWVLAGTVIGSVLLGAAAIALPSVFDVLGRLVGHVVSPFVFPWLQRDEFDQWQQAHVGTAPAHGVSTVAWAALGLIAFFPLFLVGGAPFLHHEEVTGIQVSESIPETLPAYEAFQIVLYIENTSTQPQTLVSVDFPLDVVRTFNITQSLPPCLRVKRVPFASVRSFIFNQTIQPGAELTLSFMAIASEVGEMPFEYGLCIGSDTHCVYYGSIVRVAGCGPPNSPFNLPADLSRPWRSRRARWRYGARGDSTSLVSAAAIGQGHARIRRRLSASC